tara:strand:+ start:92 stop:1045 length:954 start_codon:yes stop_codon:yes gene_type:complete
MIKNNYFQAANAVLMIRPCAFFSNPLTAESNRFQGQTHLSKDEQQAQAIREFDNFVQVLETAGIEVFQFLDTPLPVTPDAIFPNNWISFHHNGTVILYPMEAENRRSERRKDIIHQLNKNNNYLVSKIIDLSHYEKQGRYLEGTGSMVMDHPNQTIYACRSSRTDLGVLDELAKEINYTVISFDATDQNGDLIYHTNVMMSIGNNLSIVCLDAIASLEQQKLVSSSLQTNKRELLELTSEQMAAFAGNMLEVRTSSGVELLVMSEQARQSLTCAQIKKIEEYVKIISSPLNNIEASAGGSARCMLAEIYLPKLEKNA